MKAVPVEIGRKYGMLTVLAYPLRRQGFLWAEVECECGTRTRVKACNIARGRQRSCGCLSKEGGRHRLRHAMAQTPEYKAWTAAKKRCNNKNDPRYALYGARGIRMCDEWASDFCVFFRDMGPRPGKGFTLERVDGDKGYEPDNCIWATYARQNRNLSRNVFIVRQGKKYILGDLALAVGLRRGLAYNRRLYYRWPEERWLEPYTIEEAILAFERNKALANVDQVVGDNLIPVDPANPPELVEIREALA